MCVGVCCSVCVWVGVGLGLCVCVCRDLLVCVHAGRGPAGPQRRRREGRRSARGGGRARRGAGRRGPAPVVRLQSCDPYFPVAPQCAARAPARPARRGHQGPAGRQPREGARLLFFILPPLLSRPWVMRCH